MRPRIETDGDLPIITMAAPRIMDKAVEVPGALVVIVAGGTLGGVLGALVAVPLAASAVIIVRKVVILRQNLH